MKNRRHIAQSAFVAFLLVVATTGVSVHRHYCAMMGNSASMVSEPGCCASQPSANEGEAALGTIPCCQNEMQTASVNEIFTGVSLPQEPVLSMLTILPQELIGRPAAEPLRFTGIEDISPHLLHSTLERVNHLRS